MGLSLRSLCPPHTTTAYDHKKLARWVARMNGLRRQPTTIHRSTLSHRCHQEFNDTYRVLAVADDSLRIHRGRMVNKRPIV